MKTSKTHTFLTPVCQWSFLVPLIRGRWYISPQLAVYTTYIPLIYIADWVIICYLPPIKGTRNSCWVWDKVCAFWCHAYVTHAMVRKMFITYHNWERGTYNKRRKHTTAKMPNNCEKPAWNSTKPNMYTEYLKKTGIGHGCYGTCQYASISMRKLFEKHPTIRHVVLKRKDGPLKRWNWVTRTAGRHFWWPFGSQIRWLQQE